MGQTAVYKKLLNLKPQGDGGGAEEPAPKSRRTAKAKGKAKGKARNDAQKHEKAISTATSDFFCD